MSILNLAIGGDSLCLKECASPSAGSRWTRPLFGGRLANAPRSEESQHPRAVETISGSISEALTRAWASIETVRRDAQRAQLRVQLGLQHCRVGIFRTEAVRVQPDSAQAYVAAWIARIWGIDPGTQVVRWSEIGNSGNLLVSCVAKPVFEQLAAFAEQHDLRFVSCKPAVLDLLAARHAKPPNTSINQRGVVAWTEASSIGNRGELVQLAYLGDTGLAALWRGWVPFVASSVSADGQLDAALRRFIAANRINEDAPVQTVHWSDHLRSRRDDTASTEASR